MHRFERHFYEKEVVKTGQYRDHNIEEVVDRCFVMFFTRYNKGRPRNFPADKEVYVCESRYNEEKHKLNKIKTWASCLPDEVRERDYEMDLFDAPRKMKKVPSPIKHLLPPNAKETDDLPKPTWGVENAPPVVGAVHKRPREPNVRKFILGWMEGEGGGGSFQQFSNVFLGISTSRTNSVAAATATTICSTIVADETRA